jgi:Flp pilus assembly pilin Flp
MLNSHTFLADDRGLETVEYAIIAGLIVVVVLAVIASIGSKVNNIFQTLSNGI